MHTVRVKKAPPYFCQYFHLR